MTSSKKVIFNIYKPYNFKPIHKSEKRRITRLVMKELFEVANRFDGTSTVSIKINAKGNC